MPPTYEELVEIVKLQQNQIVELQKVVQQQDKQIKKQDKEIKKLHAQLRKFLNENTPSGALHPYGENNFRKLDCLDSPHCDTFLTHFSSSGQ